jgi:hypothetical protein
MKKLACKLLGFLPLAILVIGGNFFGDPANLFHAGYEDGIAHLLLQGKYVTNVGNCDERLLMKAFVAGQVKPPKVLVLGSSRSLEMNSSRVPISGIFNACVSGASIEDLLAIFRMFSEKRIPPHTLIIGLDPWILNENNDQSRWKSLSAFYVAMVGEIDPHGADDGRAFDAGFVPLKWQELVSPGYFQQSIERLWKKWRNHEPPQEYFPVDTLNNETFTRLIDGSIAYDRKFRERSEEEVLTSARSYITNRPIYSLRDFHHLSRKNQDLLEKFILHLKKQHCQLIFFLSPYHPEVYSYFTANESTQNVQLAEKFFRDLAKANAIPVVGSYNPAPYGLENKHFYDGMHLREIAYGMIFLKDREIWENFGD